MSQLSGTIWT